jgi:hypothetical protein
MKRLLSVLIAGALFTGSAGLVSAQEGVKSTIKGIGHSTKHAAKATGKATKKTTKKVVNKGAKETKKGAGKVQHMTSPKK